MGKKKILEEALIEAQELERAAIENAKEKVIESFAPDFVSFFKGAIDEAEDYDDEQGDVPGEQDTGPDEYEPVDEAEHDVGKEPDSGRQGTDPAVDDDEEALPQDKKDINEAEDDDDVDIDIDTDDEDEDSSDEDEESEDDEDEESEDDEDMDIPDDLFDDEAMDDEEDGGDVEFSDDFEDDDEEVDLDIEDDDEEDIDIEDDDVESEDDTELELDDEEEFEEGLYMRKEGEFQKVTPAEYLQTRLGELEEENRQLSAALEAMTGQLEETHLFNAKLAHLNKLYMSGVFSANEKENIAERLDDCDNIQEVKTVYKHIVNEIKDSNPLDNFSEMLKETRVPKKAKTENIYESAEAIRMRKLAGIE